MSSRKETLRLKGCVERHRGTYRQYLPWLMEQISALPDAKYNLEIKFPDAHSAEHLIVKRPNVIRSEDTVLIVLDYPSTDITPMLGRAHKQRSSVHLIHCSMQVPFLHWLLMHRGIAKRPADLKNEIMETFCADPDDKDGIPRILDQLAYADVLQATALYQQVASNDVSRFVDETYWRLSIADLIRYLESISQQRDFVIP